MILHYGHTVSIFLLIRDLLPYTGPQPFDKLDDLKVTVCV